MAHAALVSQTKLLFFLYTCKEPRAIRSLMSHAIDAPGRGVRRERTTRAACAGDARPGGGVHFGTHECPRVRGGVSRRNGAVTPHAVMAAITGAQSMDGLSRALDVHATRLNVLHDCAAISRCEALCNGAPSLARVVLVRRAWAWHARPLHSLKRTALAACVVLHAAAKVGVDDRALLVAAASDIVQCCADLGPREASSALWSLGRTGLCEAELVAPVAAAVTRLVGDMDAHQAVTALSGAAWLRPHVVGTALGARCLAAVARAAGRLEVGDLTSSFKALRNVYVSDFDDIAPLVRRAHAQRDTLPAATLALVLHGVASASVGVWTCRLTRQSLTSPSPQLACRRPSPPCTLRRASARSRRWASRTLPLRGRSLTLPPRARRRCRYTPCPWPSMGRRD